MRRLVPLLALLLVAAAGWRLPYVQHLEVPEGEELPDSDVPAPTHTPKTEDFAKIEGRRA